MKKLFFLCTVLLGMLAAAPAITSCAGDDDELNIENATVLVEGATLKSGKMPQANAENDAISVNFQGQALAGGGNIITITSPEPLKKVYVAVDGENKYFECKPELVENESRATSTAECYKYIVQLLYGLNIQENLKLNVNVETESGDIVSVLKKTAIEYVESQKGDLAINLVFDQDKDVDLWLVFPNGEHRIFYGNKTLSAVYEEDEWNKYYAAYEAEYERLQKKYKNNDEYGSDDYYAFWTELDAWVNANNPDKIDEGKARGLDHDSNASCEIDHLNNENIVIDAEFLIPGEYKVYVNLYENCYPIENDTHWTLVARSGNTNLQTTHGGNPTSGYFKYDAPSNSADIDSEAVLAMTFNLSERQIEDMKRANRSSNRKPLHIFSAPLDDKAVGKIINGNGSFNFWKPVGNMK